MSHGHEWKEEPTWWITPLSVALLAKRMDDKTSGRVLCEKNVLVKWGLMQASVRKRDWFRYWWPPPRQRGQSENRPNFYQSKLPVVWVSGSEVISELSKYRKHDNIKTQSKRGCLTGRKTLIINSHSRKTLSSCFGPRESAFVCLTENPNTPEDAAVFLHKQKKQRYWKYQTLKVKTLLSISYYPICSIKTCRETDFFFLIIKGFYFFFFSKSMWTPAVTQMWCPNRYVSRKY